MTTYAYSSESPADVKAGLLIVPVFQGPKPGPGVRETGLAKAYADARFTGKKGESVLVTRRDRDRFAAQAVLLVGVGPKGDLTIGGMRRALGRAAATARRFGSVATTFPQAFGARQAAETVQAAAEGLGLGDYRFDRYRTKRDDADGLKRVVVLGDPKWEARGLAAATKRAAIVVDAVCWARDLVNTPAGDMPPGRDRARGPGAWRVRSGSPARSGTRASSRRAASAASSASARAA